MLDESKQHGIVLHATPQVRVFLNEGGEISIAVRDLDEEQILSLPVSCAKTVARAILATAKEARDA